MFIKETVYTDSFGLPMKKLPTVQQIIAVIANIGDEIHIESADEQGYYGGQELEFYITDKGVEMCPSTDKEDVLDVLHFPVVDVYGWQTIKYNGKEQSSWHIVFSTTEEN